MPPITYERIRNWGEFDPARHPFDWDEDEDTCLRSSVREWVPPVLSGRAGWWQGERWCESQIGGVIQERYGTWAWGWRWCYYDGGPIGNWVSGPASVTTPDETAERLVSALLEWREWRERTAQRFAGRAPPPDASPGDRSWHLERACVRLVTHMLGSGAEGGWYGQASIVLSWFLTCTGMDRADAARAVESAIGGRFESWVTPERTLIESVAEDLATALTGTPLDFALLAGWQCEVLGIPEPPFRAGDACAKAGRVRYGLPPRTRRPRHSHRGAQSPSASVTRWAARNRSRIKTDRQPEHNYSICGTAECGQPDMDSFLRA
ncbi:hypothetical protein [Streptomyces sp. AM6-12]|uniref:hypothetical protein n=1 Tax=Streptomyces sp. AM6-12 TaxID=3345149 RepID=UPI0037BB8D6C